eukprot:ANDGO_05942.mRNA.1 Protein transport protein YOS1
MAFTLLHLFQSVLLFANAVVILHEGRFLKKFGLHYAADRYPGENPAKQQIRNFIHACRLLLRIPLIGINIICIIFLILFG